MADWNTVRTTIGHAASKAAHKTGEVADTASLYVKIKAAEAKLDGYYTALGKLTYKQLKSGESQAEKIAPVLEGIDAVQEKIRTLRNKIEIDKAKRKTKSTTVILETAVENAKAQKEDPETTDTETR